MKIIRVTTPCFEGNCDCAKYDFADAEEVGLPPYHNGCTCYAVEQKDTALHQFTKLHKALINLFETIAETLKITNFIEWLSRQL